MSSGALVLIVVALGTYGLKSAGPLLLGNRTLPPRLLALIGAMPPALLAALVMVNTVVARGHLVLDARIIGVAAAVAALVAKRGFVTVVVVAAVTTAIARRLGVS
jgi:uncharacterized membrane protein